MIICLCRNISDRTIAAAIEGGARDVASVRLATGAGGSCGCCLGAIEAMLAGRAPAANTGASCADCPQRVAAGRRDAP